MTDHSKLRSRVRGCILNGTPTRFEDIDCYGGIAGAIAGAMAGAEAFPASLLDQVVESNRLVYGIDLEATIERFVDRCL